MLFNILSCVRFIFIENREGKIILSVYTDRDLSDSEKELYYESLGEILGDFTDLDFEGSMTLIEVTNKEAREIEGRGVLVYARYE
ncbi:hypothetical protein DXN04_33695 [Chitinophaga silvisoli]|uniref:Uncharacterized protein n=1 Tax=Chitinophaga silvisoli TaxID=2291814 RepID=A0A3E1NMT6_9BACT|nr:hypothetical protein DXN04_33695 [Chitinophaga silvisoli]